MTSRKRLAIYYGGREYAIADRTVQDVVDEIEAGIASDAPAWLEARVGQGRSASVRLLLTRGVSIAVGAVNTDGPPTPTESHPHREGDAAKDLAAAEE